MSECAKRKVERDSKAFNKQRNQAFKDKQDQKHKIEGKKKNTAKLKWNKMKE